MSAFAEFPTAQGEDRLTTSLAALQDCKAFLKLGCCEQLGIIMVATYLRSAALHSWINLISFSALIIAEFSRTCRNYLSTIHSCELRFGQYALFLALRPGQGRFSLIFLVEQFFYHTGGVGARKAYLPTRAVGKKRKNQKKRLVRPNQDIARLRLHDVLSMCGQFLDGTLLPMFLSTTKKWQVEVDLFLSSNSNQLGIEFRYSLCTTCYLAPSAQVTPHPLQGYTAHGTAFSADLVCAGPLEQPTSWQFCILVA